ncbi:tetratricopeptide repeat protein [Leptospira meyeri]|uniref:tetratricopeptide repeat protein n=1 Tax=Leptospira meyeri TaxID=29508 RepID=UPI000C295E16|nr:hypothetical protein [Leptospira meyeri]PJZ79241.1 hypothetical protein CH359_18895 [Leptospira meyeri]PJZ95075.1 hypothetical protein CH358_18855 [Leptospira meyeri]
MDELNKNRINIMLITVISLISLLVCCSDTAKLNQLYVEGNQLFQQNQRELARKKFQEIYSVDPDYLDTRIMLGKVHYFDLEFDHAEKFFKEAHQEENSNLNALLWLIKTEYVNGKKKPEDILEKTKDFLAADNTNPEILYIRGRILEKLGKIDEAIISYTKATQNVNFVALSYLQLGIIFKKAELNERFEQNLKKAKSISEDDVILSKEINRQLKLNKLN